MSALASFASTFAVGKTVRVTVKAPRAVARATVAPVAKLMPGDKVKVSSSVVVYHVPKTKGAATELMGMEGVVDSRADDHEGTYISANLEVRVALPVPDDPKGKTFIAHVREDEVEAL